VYGWIRSVTTIEDVRSAGNFAKPLFEIANERKWPHIGVLDLAQFPYDIHKALRGGSVGLLDVASTAVFAPSQDEAELAMRRKAAALTVQILDEEIPRGVDLIDHHFVGRLERQFRRAGAEDLIVLVTNGKTVPAPPTGATLEENFSVSVAMEYRGHWVRVSRPHGSARPSVFDEDNNCQERLDSGYPYEWNTGKIMAKHTEFSHNGKRLFYGDTNL
jgi:hypothetical protein